MNTDRDWLDDLIDLTSGDLDKMYDYVDNKKTYKKTKLEKY